MSASSGWNYAFQCIKYCFGVFLRESSHTAAKRRTNLSTNSGKAIKRLDRLAPNLVHICGFVWEWTSAKYNSLLNNPRAFRGEGGLGGHKFKSLGKLSNGWTDWHQIWHTCADSSGNGYTPNNLPLETQEGTWGVFRWSNIQKV